MHNICIHINLTKLLLETDWTGSVFNWILIEQIIEFNEIWNQNYIEREFYICKKEINIITEGLLE